MNNPLNSSDLNSNLPFPDRWNYEEAVENVETIIRQIETGELPLAEVFEQFTAATKYLHQCEVFLQERQQQMDLLIETLRDEAEDW
jgi:exodeoxyribonuclease VII small subunit